MCAGKNEAVGIATTLLEDRLTACGNVVGPVESVFRWKGEVETETEYMLLLKTQKKHIRRITEKIIELHSYDLPEISTFPVTGGNEAYMDWVAESTEPEV